jgi:flagellin
MQISRIGGISNPATNALDKTGKSLAKILQRLATAQRINQASDDAAGLAISEQLNTQINGFKMASQNVADAMSALNIASGASNEIADMMQRQRELAVQASSDTLTDQQRGYLNTEYQQLNQEISRISNATQFNTQNVANGTGLASGTAQLQVGANAGDQMTAPAVDMTAQSLGINGASIATQAGATSALSTLDTALDNLNAQRTTVGAFTNRLESTQNNLSVAEINTQAAESVIRDQDMAAGIVDLTAQQLLEQTATAAFARYNQVSANHLLGLLR